MVRAAELLSRKRRCRQLSANALSRVSGLSRSYVSKLEAGRLEPSLAAFARLAAALQMSPLEVFVAVMNEAGEPVLAQEQDG